MGANLFEPGEVGGEPGSGTITLQLEAPPVPAVVEQAPVLEVYVGGAQHTLAYQARGQSGFDQRVASATVRVHVDDGGGVQPSPAAWQNVEIRVGPSEAEKFTRFYGVFIRQRATYAPGQREWECKGQLHRAAFYRNREPGGTDLSNGGAGRTDEAIVMLILDRCQVPYTAANIGGTGALWGTLAHNEDKKLNPFVWKEGETGLAAIERIDAVSTLVAGGVQGAFRTYEGIDGQIYRTHQTARPDGSSSFASFVQGQHILDGADSDLDNRDHTANRVTVDGWHTGGAKLTFTSSGSGALLPAGIDFVDNTFQSDLLEREAGASGPGRSAQQQAEYLLDKDNTSVTSGTIPTWRGDRLEPGHTVFVQAPERLQLDAHYWLERVAWEFDGGRWTQTLGVARADRA